jgi:hypothetical protein
MSVKSFVSRCPRENGSVRILSAKGACFVICSSLCIACGASGSSNDDAVEVGAQADGTTTRTDAGAATGDMPSAFKVSDYWSANANAPTKKFGRQDSAPWLLTQFLPKPRTWVTKDGSTQVSDHDYWEKSLPDLTLYDVWHFNIDGISGNVQEVADTYPQSSGGTYDVVFPTSPTGETTLVWGPAQEVHLNDSWENSTYLEQNGQGSWGYQWAQLVDAVDVFTIPHVDVCTSRTVRDVIKISEVQGYGTTWIRTDFYVSAHWGFVQRDYFANQTAAKMPSSGWVLSSSAYMDWSQKLDGSWTCLSDP